MSAVTAPIDATASTPGSLVISGTIENQDGSPAANVPVRLTALDGNASSLADSAISLVKTTTDADGAFSIDTTGCCADIEQQLQQIAADSGNGTLELELVGEPTDGIVLNDFPVELADLDEGTAASPGGRAASVRIALPDGRLQVRRIVLRTGRGLVAGQDKLDGIAPAKTQESSVAGKDSTDPTYNGAGVSAPDGYVLTEYPQGTTPADPVGEGKTSCPYELDWQDGPERTDRLVHNQVTSTRGHSTATYAWSTTNQTQLGVALTGRVRTPQPACPIAECK
jgi:hypothetical protein